MAKQQGFTIVEVLLALFIISMVIGGAAKVATSAVTHTSDLQDEAFANWVALNQISQAQIDKADKGRLDGKEEMGNTTWYWQRDIQPNEAYESLLEIEVKVFKKEGDEFAYTRVKGFRRE